MPKLVVVSEGLRGRSHELKSERTTVGRLDDNAFQLPDQSVSSHHCEVILRGSDVVVKDLNSTNGTFLGSEQISEKVVKVGQTLRLGQVELKLENGDAAPAGAEKKQSLDQTRAMSQGGVKFESSAPGKATAIFDKNSQFTKKSNKVTIIFITIGVILAAIIVIFLIWGLSSMKSQ